MSGDRDLKPDDVMYLEAGGERPMREVLAERKRKARARPFAERVAAYRTRQQVIGRMAICQCSWPLVVEPTVSGHEEWCPAHGNWASEAEVARREGAGRPPWVEVTISETEVKRRVTAEVQRNRSSKSVAYASQLHVPGKPGGGGMP